MTDPESGGWQKPQEGNPSSAPEWASESAPDPGTQWSTAGAPAASGSPEAVPAPAKPPRQPTAALGWVALAIAVLFAIADVVAIVLAVQRSWETATLIAQASNLGTAIAFVAGLFALARKPSRRLGIAAMVLALLANPFVLTHLLGFLSGS